jgi:hypothetical protein
LEEALPLPTQSDGVAVEIIDVDGDGVNDVLLSTSDGQSFLYENDGTTPFDVSGASSPLSSPESLSPPGTPGLNALTGADFSGGLLETAQLLGDQDAPDVISGNFIYPNPGPPPPSSRDKLTSSLAASPMTTVRTATKKMVVA